MASNYLRGFASLTKENPGIKLEPRFGVIPDWLNGTLIRNGPSCYDLDKYKLLHWLDGFAMLHKFDFRDGAVLYANKMLQSQAYQKAMQNGELAYREYASEPHGGWLERMYQVFASKLSDNANVNVVAIADHFLAITDVPNLVEFDPHTLNTLGSFRFDDNFKGILGPSHPHYDYRRKLTYSYFTSVDFMGDFSYNIYSVDDTTTTRRIVKTLKTKYPAYMHSFFMTENYIILPAYPWVLKNVMWLIFKMRPVIADYSWVPDMGTTFLVVHKDTGETRTWQTEAFAAFHTINAFEKDGDIFLDVATYPDTCLVDTLFFDWLISQGGGESPVGEFRRYRLRNNSALADFETMSPQAIEMPRINYERSNSKDYRYAYGYNRFPGRPNDFYNQIIKVDLAKSGMVDGWQKPGHYVGEPVFVANPEGVDEDDGVLLSVVLDTSQDRINRDCSYLLALDAKNLQNEIACFDLPHLMPLGLHGMYFDNISTLPPRTTLKRE